MADQFEGGGEIVHLSENVEGLTDNFRDILAREHGLAVIGDNLVGDIALSRHDLAKIDVAFALANPNIPAENVVSRLDNYLPRNESQEAFLEVAQRLVLFHGISRMAGVIACGTAGVGKTHMAVGVAKAAMMRGDVPAYISMPRARNLSGVEAERVAQKADFIILDDLNTQYGVEADFFRHLIPAMHDKGNGKLLITSNFSDPNLLVDSMSRGSMMNEAQVERLRDRIGGALLGVTVEGESYRRETQADQSPWWMETSPIQELPE